MLIDKINFPLFYNLIYFFTAFMVILSFISIEIKKDFIVQKKIGSFLVFIPLFLLIPLIGLREFDIGADTYTYYSNLWLIEREIDYSNEFLFTLLVNTLKNFNLSYSYFLFLVSSFFFCAIYSALKRVSSFYYSNVLYSFFAFFSFFFFLSMSINIIRQGASLACLLLAYSYSLNKKIEIKTIFYMLLSLTLHLTSIISIILFVVSHKSIRYIKINYFYFLFLITIILSYMKFGLADISPFLIDILGDNKKVTYLGEEDFGYKVGFRPQFVIFNTLFLFIAIFVKSKILNNFWITRYSILIRYYILASCIFFMAFQLPFSDRWGLLSWVVIPLFFVPLFSSRDIKYGIKIHWIFILILIFIGFSFYG